MSRCEVCDREYPFTPMQGHPWLTACPTCDAEVQQFVRKDGLCLGSRITSYNVCYTKLLRLKYTATVKGTMNKNQLGDILFKGEYREKRKTDRIYGIITKALFAKIVVEYLV